MGTITPLRFAGALILLASGLRTSAQTINAYRYWFDDDPATLVTNTVAGGQDYTLNATLDATALGKGYHRVTMQFADNTNIWSVPATSVFIRMGGQQVAWQYWFDDDVTTLVNNTMGNTDILDVATQIDASALTSGPHTVTLRTKDEQSGYSVPITQEFDLVTGIAELPGVERVVLFPNPAVEQLTLRMDAQGAQAVDIAVMDATGRVVLVNGSLSFTAMGVRTIDIAALAAGAYHLRLSNESGALDLPFVKR